MAIHKPSRVMSEPRLNLEGRASATAVERRRRGLSTSQMALLTLAALVMGILALLRVDSSRLGDLGLVTVVGPTYFAAIALLTVSFGFALAQQPLRRPLLAFQIIGLIVLLDGLGPLVEPHASFATSWLHAGFLARDSARCPVGDVPGNGECVKDLRWSRLDQGGEPDVRRTHGRMIGTHAVPTPLAGRLQVPEAHPPCILDGTARRLPDRNAPMHCVEEGRLAWAVFEVV